MKLIHTLTPIFISVFIALVSFIYITGQAQSKEDIAEVRELANKSLKSAEEALKGVSEVNGDIKEINTNIGWMKSAMSDNNIKPRYAK